MLEQGRRAYRDILPHCASNQLLVLQHVVLLIPKPLSLNHRVHGVSSFVHTVISILPDAIHQLNFRLKEYRCCMGHDVKLQNVLRFRPLICEWPPLCGLSCTCCSSSLWTFCLLVTCVSGLGSCPCPVWRHPSGQTARERTKATSHRALCPAPRSHAFPSGVAAIFVLGNPSGVGRSCLPIGARLGTS